MNNLVSIIIPTYKENNEYFNECLKSACEQAYSNKEVIVVNDGMTEENIQLVTDYMNKYSFVRMIGDKNEGVCAARNKGIKASRGDWLLFMDSDDSIDLDYIEKMLSAADGYDCVICGHKRVYDDHVEEIHKGHTYDMTNVEFLQGVLDVQNCFGFMHCKLWKADVIRESGVLLNTDLSLAEDALFCIEMTRYFTKVKYLDECLYNYRFNTQSAVRKFKKDYVDNFKLSMEEAETVMDTYYNDYKNPKFYNYVMYHVLLILVNYCAHPDNKENHLKTLKNVCRIPLFKEAIKHATYDNLSMTRKVPLFFLKRRLYRLALFIGDVRQKQFAK